jgi:hypothetical protein
MLDILGNVGLNPTQFFILFAVCAASLLIAYWRFILGLLDPLNVFLIGTCACLVLINGLDWNSSVKILFTIFIVFFWIGFALVGRPPADHPTIELSRNSVIELEIVLLFLCLIIIAANLYLGMTVGFPLLSANPSISKVASFTGGLGFVRRLNMGPFFFLICGCTILITIGQRRGLALTLLVVTSALVALSGSKGAILLILYAQAFAIAHKGLRANRKSIRFVKRLAVPSFAAACAVAIAVMIRDNGGLGAGMIFFAKRLLYFGDTILFYFPRRGNIPELFHVGFGDYVEYLLDPTLGMFRLKEYGVPLGTIIAGYLDLGFGPNAKYFVRADIFFGPIMGCVYCLIMGALSALMRRFFFTLRTGSAIYLAFALMLATSALDLAIESQTFVTNVIDAALVIGPLWMVGVIARTAAAPSRSIANAVN